MVRQDGRWGKTVVRQDGALTNQRTNQKPIRTKTCTKQMLNSHEPNVNQPIMQSKKARTNKHVKQESTQAKHVRKTKQTGQNKTSRTKQSQ